MPKGLLNRGVLDKVDALELQLDILSFSGGENTIGEDQALKINEARVIKNWKATSLGGMIRAEGFNEVADGGATYTLDVDLLIEHNEGANTELYGVIEGDLVIKSSSDINQEDAAAFTTGLLCHAVSAGGALWVTNKTDNLKRKTIGVGIAAATDQPATACDRIYYHKQRLIAEGSGSLPKRVYGSVAGTGNWNGANGWTTSGDAWNIDLPEDTQGCATNFPTGDEVAVFTKFEVYSLYNFPNVAFRPIGSKSSGCSAPYSIARGNEGVFYLSEFPVKAVILWDGVNFIDLTHNHDFIDNVNFGQRIFGIYRNQEYHLFYNETGSGVTYPNRWRIYDTKFGRWWERSVNTSLSDNFGYPTILHFSNSELYVGSSVKDKFYELETTDTSDELNDTQASYKTKDFSSADFKVSTGGDMIDDVKLKLIKMVLTVKGTTGVITVQWTADKGRASGSQTFDMTQDGDIINVDFTVNTSKVVTSPPATIIFKSVNNSAVGRKFNFQIKNNGQGVRPEISKLKIYAIALDEI